MRRFNLLRMGAAPPLAALGLASLLWGVAPSVSTAHVLEFSYTIVIFSDDGGIQHVQVDVTCDLDALALGVAPGSNSAAVARRLLRLSDAELERRIARVRATLQEQVEIRFDNGDAVEWEPQFPTAGAAPDGTNDFEVEVEPTVLGLTARFSGAAPEGAETMSVSLDRRLPPLYLTIYDSRTGRSDHQLKPRGVASDPFPIGPIGIQADRAGWKSTVKRFSRLGFTHILPHGLDHILFVLSLFLLSARLRPLLIQITAFTAAHTLTLALASHRVLQLSPNLVEPLIALSIVWVAMENVRRESLTASRPFVVFGFGLVHGLGFAQVLSTLPLTRQETWLGLLSFNVGVELGQLAVVAIAALSIGRYRDRRWYRARVTVPLSLAIAAVGLVWAVQRAFI